MVDFLGTKLWYRGHFIILKLLNIESCNNIGTSKIKK